jgi:chromosome segregation ATPase
MSDQHDEIYIKAATNHPDKILWYRFKNSNGNEEMHNMKNATIIVKHNKTSTTEADLAIEKEFTEAQKRLENAQTELTEAQKRLENAQTELTEAQKNIEEIEKKPLVIGASYDIYNSNNNLKCDMCKLIKKLEPLSTGGKGAKQRRKTKAQNKGAKQRRKTKAQNKGAKQRRKTNNFYISKM